MNLIERNISHYHKVSEYTKNSLEEQENVLYKLQEDWKDMKITLSIAKNLSLNQLKIQNGIKRLEVLAKQTKVLSKGISKVQEMFDKTSQDVISRGLGFDKESLYLSEQNSDKLSAMKELEATRQN